MSSKVKGCCAQASRKRKQPPFYQPTACFGGLFLCNKLKVGGDVAKLTEKQKRFADEYLIDLNATQAAARAGYSDPNFGRQLITKPNVSAYIQKRQARLQAKLEITQEMVLAELASIGFARVTNYATIDGPFVKIKPTEDMADEAVAAVASIKQGAHGIELKLYDKPKALELIGRHLGMFNEKVDVALAIVEDLEAIDNKYRDDADD